MKGLMWRDGRGEDEGVDEEIATADPEAPEMKLRKLATKPTLDEEGFNAKLA